MESTDETGHGQIKRADLTSVEKCSASNVYCTAGRIPRLAHLASQ